MGITTHTLSIQIAGKDIMAFKGRRLDDGSAVIDAHLAGHTVRAEWSTDAGRASAEETKVRVSADGGAAESLTLTRGLLMGPVGPWEPGFERGALVAITPLVEDTATLAPETNGDSGFWATVGAAIGAYADKHDPLAGRQAVHTHAE